MEKILRLTGVGGGKVLDLCCGPGRHAVALAKRGFAVTAVDRTRFLLDHARARAAQAGLSVEFVLEDMRLHSPRDLRPDHQHIHLVRILPRPGGRLARVAARARKPQTGRSGRS